MATRRRLEDTDLYTYCISEDAYLKVCIHPNGWDAVGLKKSKIDLFIQNAEDKDTSLDALYDKIAWIPSEAIFEKFIRNATFSTLCWCPMGNILFVGTSAGNLIALAFQREKRSLQYLFGTSLKRIQPHASDSANTQLLELYTFPTSLNGTTLVLFGLLGDGTLAILENNQNIQRPKIQHFNTLPNPLRLCLYPLEVATPYNWQCNVAICSLDEYQWFHVSCSQFYELHRSFLPQPISNTFIRLENAAFFCLSPHNPYAFIFEKNSTIDQNAAKLRDEKAATSHIGLDPMLCILGSYRGGFTIAIIQKHTFIPIYVRHVCFPIIGGCFCVFPRASLMDLAVMPTASRLLNASSHLHEEDSDCIFGVCLFQETEVTFISLPAFVKEFGCTFGSDEGIDRTMPTFQSDLGDPFVGYTVPTHVHCKHTGQFYPLRHTPFGFTHILLWLLSPVLNSNRESFRRLSILLYDKARAPLHSSYLVNEPADEWQYVPLEELYRKIEAFVSHAAERPFSCTEEAKLYYVLCQHLLQHIYNHKSLDSNAQAYEATKTETIQGASLSMKSAIEFIVRQALAVAFSSSRSTSEFLYLCIQFLKDCERTINGDILDSVMVLQRAQSKLTSFDSIISTLNGSSEDWNALNLSRHWNSKDWLIFLNEDTAKQCAMMAHHSAIRQMMILFNEQSSFFGNTEEERELQVLSILEALPVSLTLGDEQLLPKWLSVYVIPLLRNRELFFGWLADRAIELEAQTEYFESPLHLLSCVFQDPVMESDGLPFSSKATLSAGDVLGDYPSFTTDIENANTLNTVGSHSKVPRVVATSQAPSSRAKSTANTSNAANEIAAGFCGFPNAIEESEWAYMLPNDSASILSPSQYITSELFWIAHGPSCRGDCTQNGSIAAVPPILPTAPKGMATAVDAGNIEGNYFFSNTEKLWKVYCLLVECYHIQNAHGLSLRLNDFLNRRMNWMDVAYQLVNRVTSPDLLRDEVEYHLKPFCDTHHLVVEDVLYSYISDLLESESQHLHIHVHGAKHRETRAVSLIECIKNAKYRTDCLLKLLRLPMTTKNMAHELKELLENIKSLNVDNNTELANRIAFLDIQRILDKYSIENASQLCNDTDASRRLVYHVLSLTDYGLQSYLDGLMLLKHFSGFKDKYLDEADACCVRLRYICQSVKINEATHLNYLKDETLWQNYFTVSSTQVLETMSNIQTRVKATERFVCFVWQCLEANGKLLDNAYRSKRSAPFDRLENYKQQCRLLAFAACDTLRSLLSLLSNTNTPSNGIVSTKSKRLAFTTEPMPSVLPILNFQHFSTEQWASPCTFNVLSRLSRLMNEFDIYIPPSSILAYSEAEKDTVFASMDVVHTNSWEPHAAVEPFAVPQRYEASFHWNGEQIVLRENQKHFDAYALPYITAVADELIAHYKHRTVYLQNTWSPSLPSSEQTKPSHFRITPKTNTASVRLIAENAVNDTAVTSKPTSLISSRTTQLLRLGALMAVGESYVRQSIVQMAAGKESSGVCLRLIQELDRFPLPRMAMDLVYVTIRIFNQLYYGVDSLKQPSGVIETVAQLLEVLSVCLRLCPASAIPYVLSISLDTIWVFQLLLQSDLLDKARLRHGATLDSVNAPLTQPLNKLIKTEWTEAEEPKEPTYRTVNAQAQHSIHTGDTLVFLMAFASHSSHSLTGVLLGGSNSHYNTYQTKSQQHMVSTMDTGEDAIEVMHFQKFYKEIHSLIPSKSALQWGLDYLYLKNQYRDVEEEAGWWSSCPDFATSRNAKMEAQFLQLFQSSVNNLKSSCVIWHTSAYLKYRQNVYLKELNLLECNHLAISLMLRHPYYVENLKVTSLLLQIAKEAFTKVVKGPDPVDGQFAIVLSSAFVNKDAWQIFVKEGLCADNVKTDYRRFFNMATLGHDLGFLHGEKHIIRETKRLMKLSKWAMVARMLKISFNENEYFRKVDMKATSASPFPIQRAMLDSLIIRAHFNVNICLEFGKDFSIPEEEVIAKVIELYLCSPTLSSISSKLMDKTSDRITLVNHGSVVTFADNPLIIDMSYRFVIPSLLPILSEPLARRVLLENVLNRVSPYDYERIEFLYSSVNQDDKCTKALSVLKRLKSYRRSIPPSTGELQDSKGSPVSKDTLLFQAFENLAEHRLPFHKLLLKPWEVLGPEINDHTINILKSLSHSLGLQSFEFELQLIWNLARQQARDTSPSDIAADPQSETGETYGFGLANLTTHLNTIFRNDAQCAVAAAILLLERLPFGKEKLKLSEWCVRNVAACTFDSIDLELGQPPYQKLHVSSQVINHVKKYVSESNSLLQTQWELQQCNLSQFSVLLPNEVDFCIECLYFYVTPILMQYNPQSLPSTFQQAIYRSLTIPCGGLRKEPTVESRRTNLHTVVNSICSYYHHDMEKLLKTLLISWIKNSDQFGPLVSLFKKEKDNFIPRFNGKDRLAHASNSSPRFEHLKNFLKSLEQSQLTVGLEEWYLPSHTTATRASHHTHQSMLFTLSKALSFIQNPQDMLCVLRTSFLAEGIPEDQRVKVLLTLFFDESASISCKCRVGAVLFRTCRREAIQRRYRKFSDLPRIWLHFFYMNAFDELKIPQEFGKFYRTEKTGLARSLWRQYHSLPSNRDTRLLQLICYMCIDFTIRDGLFISEILAACHKEGVYEFLKNFLYLLHHHLLHKIPLDLDLIKTLEHLMEVPLIDAIEALHSISFQAQNRAQWSPEAVSTPKRQDNTLEDIHTEGMDTPKNSDTKRKLQAQSPSTVIFIPSSLCWLHSVPSFISLNPAHSFFDVPRLFHLYIQLIHTLFECLSAFLTDIPNQHFGSLDKVGLQFLNDFLLQLIIADTRSHMKSSDCFSGYTGHCSNSHSSLYTMCSLINFRLETFRSDSDIAPSSSTHVNSSYNNRAPLEAYMNRTADYSSLASSSIKFPPQLATHLKFPHAFEIDKSSIHANVTAPNHSISPNANNEGFDEVTITKTVTALYNLGLSALLKLSHTATKLLKIIPNIEIQDSCVIRELLEGNQYSIVPFFAAFCNTSINRKLFEAVVANNLIELYYDVVSSTPMTGAIGVLLQRNLEAFHHYTIETMQIKSCIEILLLRSDTISLKTLLNLLNNFMEFYSFSHKRAAIVNFITGRSKSESFILDGLSKMSLRGYEYIKTVMRSLKKQENLAAVFPSFLELIASENIE